MTVSEVKKEEGFLTEEELKCIRSYDIRGVWCKDLTPRLIEAIASVLPEVSGRGEFVLARDTRRSSPEIINIVLNTLGKRGCSIRLARALPNPVAYFACWNEDVPGVYVTASHNPPEYNGLKLIREDGTSFTHELETIRRLLKEGKISDEPLADTVSITSISDIIDRYIENLEIFIEINRKVKVVIETFGGAVNIILNKLCERFNINQRVLHPEIRWDFYGLRPEPKGSNLLKLKEMVVQTGADFGVAFDGDGDRCVIVDNKGRILDGSLAGAILVERLVDEGDKVVLAPDVSSSLESLIEEYGGKPIYCRVGHNFIEEKVRDEDAVLGIEQSSHFYFGFMYPFSDGIATMLVFAEIASRYKISELVDGVKLNPVEKMYIPVPSHYVKNKVIEFLKILYDGRGVDARMWPDGVEVRFSDYRVLFRASQTMPEICFVIEAKNRVIIEREKERYMRLLNRLIEEYSSTKIVRENELH